MAAAGEAAMDSRTARLCDMLAAPAVAARELQELLWRGAPSAVERPELRAAAWQLLLGYLPLEKDRRASALERKRREYRDLVQRHYEATGVSGGAEDGGSAGLLGPTEARCLRDIRKDVPRTLQFAGLLSTEGSRERLERILFVWSVRHPATGYVQGLNDLAQPLLAAFFAARVGCAAGQLTGGVVEGLDEETKREVEADVYWCLQQILTTIQDHYIHGQPGIQNMIARLDGILRRVDAPLHAYLERSNVRLMHVAFRWINCLMVRELTLDCLLRLWDTLLAEPAGFAAFLAYFCAVYLANWSAQLTAAGEEELMVLCSKGFDTSRWTPHDVELLLAEAFVLQSLFDNSPSHLAPNG